MLRVTKLTDYATVVLTVLAARPGEVLSATELAEFTGLEPPTVSKVLKPLAQAGLVEGLRGVRGGYRLTRPAIEISLFEVVEAMEGPLALTECSHDHHQCGMAPKCGARSSWRLINDVVSEALRDVTLAQILPLFPLPMTNSAAPSLSTSSPDPQAAPMATETIENVAHDDTPNREIHEQLGRKYSAGFITEIESDSCRRAWTRTPSVPCRPRRTSRSG